MSEVRPTSPRDLRELLDAPLTFLREQGRPLLPVLVAGPLAAALPLNLGPLLQGLFSLGGKEGEIIGLMVGTLATYFTSLAALVIYGLHELAVLAALRAHREGRLLSVREAWKQGITANLVVAGILKYLVLYVSVLCCGFPALYTALVMIPFIPMVAMARPEWVRVRGRDELRPNDAAKALRRCFTYAHHKPDPGQKGATSLFTWTRLIVVAHALLFVAMPITALANLPTVVITGLHAFRKVASGINPEDISALGFGLPIYLNLPLSILAACGAGIGNVYQTLLGIQTFEDLRDSVDGEDIEAALDARLGGPA
jgi:hypothetical protein